MRPNEKTIRKARNSAFATKRGKAFGAIGKQFVSVALVPDVKYDFILRKIEYTVQCDRQLYRSEVGSKMSAALRDGVYDLFAQFFAKVF